MSEKKISYLSRTFEDYQGELREYIKKYYPSIANKLDDASIASWLIDMTASVADNLSYYIDRAYGETIIDSASQTNSVYALARSNGFKIPTATASIAEEKISCVLPIYVGGSKQSSSKPGLPDFTFAPVIKKGTKIASGSQVFELTEDVDFSSGFDNDMYPNMDITPITNGVKTTGYRVSKYTTVSAGESKIYKKIIQSSDVTPFMEIVLPEKNILSIESIIFKDASAYDTTPLTNEFMNPNEYVPAEESQTGTDTYRYFEVDSLLQQYRWGDDVTTTRSAYETSGIPKKYTYGYYDSEHNTNIPLNTVVKGEWVPLTQKFVTEVTDQGYTKIIFGSGEPVGTTSDYSNAKDFSKNRISKMVRNNFLGKLPNAGWCVFVLYRVGGGASSNVAVNTINQLIYLNAEFNNCPNTEEATSIMGSVRKSLTFTNTTPSVSGKDAPTVDEIKAMIKYNNASQERCVTLKDYESRISMMPPRYGLPFRIRATEENNKIMIYLLGIDQNGYLTGEICEQMIKNISNYLSMYRMVNDYVEIKAGRVINISFDVDIVVDKTYDTTVVIENVINVIKNYLDINKHELGEEIYVGDIEKEISKTDGVMNIIDLNIWNEFGQGYSTTITNQLTYGIESEEPNKARINIDDTDYALSVEPDEMLEIRYPDRDIRIRAKVR